MAGIDSIIASLDESFEGLVFANLVDFDALYGHRNNPRGYADALEAFDRRLPEIFNRMKNRDVLIITADHGNDPTTPSTDHSRERTPVLVYGEHVRKGVDLGTRETFADVAATIGELIDLGWKSPGKSFADEIISRK
jgi:phosphopentomutase